MIALKDIVLRLGRGAFFRKIEPNGKGEIQLMNPDKTVEVIDWELYHKFRSKGYGELVAYPSCYAAGSSLLFEGIPGHDSFYYFGLSEKGKQFFYELMKESKDGLRKRKN